MSKEKHISCFLWPMPLTGAWSLMWRLFPSQKASHKFYCIYTFYFHIYPPHLTLELILKFVHWFHQWPIFSFINHLKLSTLYGLFPLLCSNLLCMRYQSIFFVLDTFQLCQKPFSIANGMSYCLCEVSYQTLACCFP